MSSKKDHRKGSGMSGQPPHSPAKRQRFDSPEKNDDASTSSTSVATVGKPIVVKLTLSPEKRYTSTLLSSTKTAASVVYELDGESLPKKGAVVLDKDAMDVENLARPQLSKNADVAKLVDPSTSASSASVATVGKPIVVKLTLSPEKRYTSTLLSSTKTAASVVYELASESLPKKGAVVLDEDAMDLENLARPQLSKNADVAKLVDPSTSASSASVATHGKETSISNAIKKVERNKLTSSIKKNTETVAQLNQEVAKLQMEIVKLQTEIAGWADDIDKLYEE